MFEQQEIVLTAALAGLAFGLVPLLWVSAARSFDGDRDDSWRDEAPLLLRLIRPLLRALAPLVDANLEKKRRAQIADRLTEGGLGYTLTAAELIIVRWIVTLGAVGTVGWLVNAYRLWTTSYLVALLALIPLAFFYIDIWLRDAVKTRRLRIEKDFPFFLDILVLSMRAGLAFPSAFHEATTQLPDGPMRQELARVIREIRTGLSRRDALSRLAARIRLASISNFVAVVAQAEDTGGSLTSALTEQARQRRRERFQRAEKLANQAPVKLLFPLVAFLFPVTFIILGFPIVSEIKDSGLFSFG